jgi:hypothetical protein
MQARPQCAPNKCTKSSADASGCEHCKFEAHARDLSTWQRAHLHFATKSAEFLRQLLVRVEKNSQGTLVDPVIREAVEQALPVQPEDAPSQLLGAPAECTQTAPDSRLPTYKKVFLTTQLALILC